jgi:hypothetical protein
LLEELSLEEQVALYALLINRGVIGIAFTAFEDEGADFKPAQTSRLLVGCVICWVVFL